MYFGSIYRLSGAEGAEEGDTEVFVGSAEVPTDAVVGGGCNDVP